MKITYVLELLEPTQKKQRIIRDNIREVARLRAEIAKKLADGEKGLSTADFKDFDLPSAVKNQDIREVRSLYRRFKKSDSEKEHMEFKPNQPICYNNQNHRIDGHIISIPLCIDRCKRFAFPVRKNERLKELSQHIEDGYKRGKASLFYKRGKWFFAVTITVEGKESQSSNIMGIDIGLRQLAVASVKTREGQEANREFHSGKEAGFIRKKYRASRRSMGRAKKPEAINALNDKEQRWMTDLSHKISPKLINFEVQEQVGIVIMEALKNIRQTAYSLNRADCNLQSWV